MLLIHNHSTDPYFNHALEEYFLTKGKSEYFILWRSSPCVLIGRNQNAFREVNLGYVEENNMPVVRRLSGGGAIYNDLGNILFGFISNDTKDVLGDFKRFTAPILLMLQDFGLCAELSGRNDLMLDGRKISGNAQARHDSRLLHHGSLLYSADLGKLSQALNVNPLKFKDKAIKSTIGRVGNISDLLPEPMDIDTFIQRIFEYVLHSDSNNQVYELTSTDLTEIEMLKTKKTATWEWNFGQSPKSSYISEKKCTGGIVEVHAEIHGGKLQHIKFYGDFFGTLNLSDLEEQLTMIPYEYETVKQVLISIPLDQYMKNIQVQDLLELLFQGGI